MSITGSGMLAIEDVEKYLLLSNRFLERFVTEEEQLVEPSGRIYYNESETPADGGKGATLDSLRPYVILAPERLNYQPGGVGEDTVLLADGGVLAVISDKVRDGHSYKESFRNFWGWLSSVTDEIAGMHRTDDHFRFSIALAVIPWRPALTERAADDFWECVLVFSYGANQ